MKKRMFPSLALAAASVLTACSQPEPGSQESLEAQVEGIEIPSGMVELGQKYTRTCPPGTCPTFVVWYRLTVPPEEVHVELVEALTAAGWDVNEASAGPAMFAATNEDHVMFVVMDQEMTARNTFAPTGTNAEISVQLQSPPAR